MTDDTSEIHLTIFLKSFSSHFYFAHILEIFYLDLISYFGVQALIIANAADPTAVNFIAFH